MSELEEEKVLEYFLTVKEVRGYVNNGIDKLIQIMEKRKGILNWELDGLESKIEQDETKGREFLKKLLEYEKSTIDLFEDSETTHLETIRYKIITVESELSRKKLKLEWTDTNLEDKLSSIGYVTYEKDQNDSSIYEEIDMSFEKEEIEPSKTCDEDSKEDYESMTLTPKDLTESNYRPKPPLKPKPSPVSWSLANNPDTRATSLPKRKADREYILPEWDCDPQIFYDTIDPDDESPVFEKTNTVEQFMYKEQSDLEFGLKKNLNRSSSMKSLTKVNTTRKESQTSLSLTTSEYESEFNLDYEKIYISDNEDAPDAYNTESSNYAAIDEHTLVDLVETSRTRTMAKVRRRPKMSRSSTLGRVKPKAIFDLPQLAKCRKGDGIGQLNKPKAISISSKGNIFVAEKGNNRVQVFSSEGNYLLSFGEKSGQNKMVGPNGICVFRDCVYVTLTNKHIIQQYTLQGGFVKQKGKEGREEGKFKLPTGIDGDDSRGKIYICDTGNDRVQIFDSELRFIKALRTTCLEKPLDIKVIEKGDFIVLDRSPQCIHFFNNSGELVKEIIRVPTHSQVVNPLYFAVSREGDILLSDYSNDCIHVFSAEGKLIWSLGEAGKGKPFVEPRGVACDKDGRLVTVCNKNYEMLQIFKI